MTTQERFRGCLLGLACGDAVGTTLEFRHRGSFISITDMIGGGPFNLKAGEWTDDTSMALCLAASLVYHNGFHPVDQMNRYCNWMELGYMSSNGTCFDIGVTVHLALNLFRSTGNPFSGSDDPKRAGNGCIMRLAPVPMFFFPDHTSAIHFSGESSRTTHGALECIEASRLFGSMLIKALRGESKNAILFGSHFQDKSHQPESVPIRDIADGKYRNKTEENIDGSGYVVSCLEAALWCFLHTESFEEAVLQAANLGNDADTTATVCGQLAGAYYGVSAIPDSWLHKLVMRSDIEKLADQLLTANYQAEQ
jgi:ADP-ribosyl-[dinitrogen reductase] hydrolase